MMSEASFASLGPTLLARKGGAKPAMRPQLAPLPENLSEVAALADEQLEDLGWNDMGCEGAANDVADTDAPLFPTKRAGKSDTLLTKSHGLDDEHEHEHEHGHWHGHDEASTDADYTHDVTHDDAFCEAEDDENPPPPHPIIDPLTSADIVPITGRQMRRSPANEDTSSDEVSTDPESSAPHSDEPEAMRQQERLAQGLLASTKAKPPEAIETSLEESEIEGPLLRQKRQETAPATAQESGADQSNAAPKSAPASGKKTSERRAAFTLRLDAERHLKLRLAATMQGVSAQSLVTQALDAMLDDNDDLEALIARMTRN